MEDEGIEANTYIQLIHGVAAWAESRASTLYSRKVYRHDFLPMPTGSAVRYFPQFPRLPFLTKSIDTRTERLMTERLMTERLS